MHEITPTPSAQYRADLEEFERHDGRPAFALNMTELKLLGIAGVRPLPQFFFLSNL
jgi:PHS family inorganic phosphate transporter-like MFS transporter